MTNDDTLKKIQGLAKRLKERKGDDDRLFVLVLGSEVMPLVALEDRVLADRFDEGQIRQFSQFERLTRFTEAWKRLEGKHLERARILQPVFEADGNMLTGYSNLASLIREGYFRVILTADISERLEDALTSAGMAKSLWSSYDPFRDSVEGLRQSLQFDKRKVKIVRLGGDLNRQVAIHSDETFSMGERLRPVLEEYIAKELLVVGYNQSRDRHLFSHGAGRQGLSLYFVNPIEPPSGSDIVEALQARRSDDWHIITGDDATFDTFFGRLHSLLLEPVRALQHITPQQVHHHITLQPHVGLTEPPDVPPNGSLEPSVPKPVIPSPVELVPDDTVMTVSCEDGPPRVSFRVRGSTTYESVEAHALKVNRRELNQTLNEMGENLQLRREHGAELRWRHQVKREGELLFTDVFASNAELMRQLGKSQGNTGDDESLIMAFGGPRNHLGLPFELLFDNVPLVVRHPICRQVSGVSIRPGTFKNLLLQRRREGRPLQILLIASDTGGLFVDFEVKEMAETIQRSADVRRTKIEIKLLPTTEAGYDAVEFLLRKCRYDIVHFAGHGQFNQDRPEESYLELWERNGKGGGKKRLTARALAGLLRGSDTHLMFLNTCVGAVVGEADLLQQNYLGVMDAIIQAEVPSVLGYRWNVTDAGALLFATRFYEALFQTHCPAKAAYRARRAVYDNNADDETWTSPIIVVQNL